MQAAEEMKKYWDSNNILVDDDELLVLKVLGGPQGYSYAVRLRSAKVDLEINYKGSTFFHKSAAVKFEDRLIAGFREMNEEMINEDGVGQSWAKKGRTR